MKTLGLALLAFLLQQPAPASLRGTVVKWGTTDPLAQAIVELRAESGGNRPIASTVSSEKGEFVFPNVPAARYRVVATRQGYASAEYGQRRPNGSGQMITLATGQQKTGVQIGMSEGATVFGRILDRNGQPLPFAEVHIQKIDYRTGRASLVDVQNTITNDLGEYRIFWVTPGQYYVQASANNTPTFGSSMLVNPGGADTSGTSISITSRSTARVTRGVGLEPGESFAPIYYPSTPDLQKASLVELRAGTELNINFTIIPVRTRSVHGVVLDAATAQPVQGTIRASIYPVERYLQTGGLTLQFNSNNGVFDFTEMRPGAYEVGATVGDLGARTVIDIPDRDVDVTLRALPVVRVAGTVRVEGQPALSGPLQLAIRGALGTFNAMVPVTGAFEFPKVPVSSYQIGVMPFAPLSELPSPAGSAPGPPPRARVVPAIWQDAYVKSIKIGDRDFTNTELVVEGQPLGPLEIVIGVNGSAVDGRAIDAAQQPVGNATVVLIPRVDPPVRPDRYRAVSADESGLFQFRGLPPGEYLAYAWEDVDPGAWFNPAFMRLYEASGQQVRIVEGQKQTVEIRAFPVR
jgi:hypothetical protein